MANIGLGLSAITSKAPSGGGGGMAANINGDTHPTSPTAFDDEFEGGSLGGIWTQNNSPTLTFVKGSVVFTETGSGPDNIHSITQSPLPSTPYTFACKCSLQTKNSNYCTAGLILLDSVSGKIKEIGVGYNAGWQLQVNWFTNFSTFNSTQFFLSLTNTIIEELYFAIFDDGTNFNYQFSFDGIGWLTIYSESNTSFMTPDSVGIFYNQNASGVTGTADFDWFRKIA